MLGFGAVRLRTDMNRLLASLFHQGVLDEQFLQLQQLEDETSPNFVSEVVTIYFHESEKLLRNLRHLLMERERWDEKKMEIHLNQMMGSSSSIGAKRLLNICAAFRASLDHNNRPACMRALELLEHEYCYLKNKLHELFQIEQQRVLGDTARYPGPINPPPPLTCMRALELLEHEYCYLKNKLHELFQIEQQRVLGDTARYPGPINPPPPLT